MFVWWYLKVSDVGNLKNNNVVTMNNEADGNDGDGVDKEKSKGGIKIAKGKCRI